MLKNQYEDDIVLKNILKRTMPKSVLDEIEPDLNRFGQRVIDGKIYLQKGEYS